MTGTETDARLLVHAYLDGELDPANALEAERMIAENPALAGEYERVRALQRALRELPPESPPASLRPRIEAAVGLHRGRQYRPSWMALAASVLIAAAIGSAGTVFVLHPAASEDPATAIVADHIRALMAPQPIDVASSDRHTVKPWFNGRIAEAPRVVDLSKEDFPLVGGRLEVIGHTPVATLVYHRRKHLISLTEVPSPGRSDAPPKSQSDAGYNLVTWTTGGVTYWAVSDLAANELAHFAELFRTSSVDSG